MNTKKLVITPPRTSLSIVQRLESLYKNWQEFLRHFPKTSRYTLGGKIDVLFIEIIEAVLTATRLYKNEKIPFLSLANSKLDLLNFLLKIAWEIRAIDNKKFIFISEQLVEIAKMLNGWQKNIIRQTSANLTEEQR